ncbi:MAG: DUF1624 domain-containing protein, partial [Clostridia bacterium]|nr:DUF1624 domain-containing protein [Clostridia bacterium]
MTKEEKLLKLSKRAPELDILRGIAVLFMIFDHFMYDCYDMMGYFFYDYGKTEFTRELVRFARNYWNWDVRVVFRQFILFVFLGLTGICCSFSKSNLKRGFKLMAVAIGLTVATYGIGVITGDI